MTDEVLTELAERSEGLVGREIDHVIDAASTQEDGVTQKDCVITKEMIYKAIEDYKCRRLQIEGDLKKFTQ